MKWAGMKSAEMKSANMRSLEMTHPLLVLGIAAFTIAPFAGLLWRTREWFGW
ncbi:MULTISPECIES: hypothetical protein [Mesorhizobium]|uniref:Uncharacterized protein n=2 Tax=Mesorhizobium abyssinicae TaxID=1209958 RepID=A0ABU5AWW7_9HYPH|nr:MULTISPECIES: hypothetical protein [Mesorhizobium]MDX8541784.1 hypothetical protein [Mesorhizobium abyssinicae]